MSFRDFHRAYDAGALAGDHGARPAATAPRGRDRQPCGSAGGPVRAVVGHDFDSFLGSMKAERRATPGRRAPGAGYSDTPTHALAAAATAGAAAAAAPAGTTSSGDPARRTRALSASAGQRKLAMRKLSARGGGGGASAAAQVTAALSSTRPHPTGAPQPQPQLVGAGVHVVTAAPVPAAPTPAVSMKPLGAPAAAAQHHRQPPAAVAVRPQPHGASVSTRGHEPQVGTAAASPPAHAYAPHDTSGVSSHASESPERRAALFANPVSFDKRALRGGSGSVGSAAAAAPPPGMYAEDTPTPPARGVPASMAAAAHVGAAPLGSPNVSCISKCPSETSGLSPAPSPSLSPAAAELLASAGRAAAPLSVQQHLQDTKQYRGLLAVGGVARSPSPSTNPTSRDDHAAGAAGAVRTPPRAAPGRRPGADILLARVGQQYNPVGAGGGGIAAAADVNDDDDDDAPTPLKPCARKDTAVYVPDGVDDDADATGTSTPGRVYGYGGGGAGVHVDRGAVYGSPQRRGYSGYSDGASGDGGGAGIYGNFGGAGGYAGYASSSVGGGGSPPRVGSSISPQNENENQSYVHTAVAAIAPPPASAAGGDVDASLGLWSDMSRDLSVAADAEARAHLFHNPSSYDSRPVGSRSATPADPPVQGDPPSSISPEAAPVAEPALLVTPERAAPTGALPGAGVDASPPAPPQHTSQHSHHTDELPFEFFSTGYGATPTDHRQQPQPQRTAGSPGDASAAGASVSVSPTWGRGGMPGAASAAMGTNSTAGVVPLPVLPAAVPAPAAPAPAAVAGVASAAARGYDDHDDSAYPAVTGAGDAAAVDHARMHPARVPVSVPVDDEHPPAATWDDSVVGGAPGGLVFGQSAAGPDAGAYATKPGATDSPKGFDFADAPGSVAARDVINGVFGSPYSAMPVGPAGTETAAAPAPAVLPIVEPEAPPQPPSPPPPPPPALNLTPAQERLRAVLIGHRTRAKWRGHGMKYRNQVKDMQAMLDEAAALGADAPDFLRPELLQANAAAAKKQLLAYMDSDAQEAFQKPKEEKGKAGAGGKKRPANHKAAAARRAAAQRAATAAAAAPTASSASPWDDVPVGGGGAAAGRKPPSQRPAAHSWEDTPVGGGGGGGMGGGGGGGGGGTAFVISTPATTASRPTGRATPRGPAAAKRAAAEREAAAAAAAENDAAATPAADAAGAGDGKPQARTFLKRGSRNPRTYVPPPPKGRRAGRGSAAAAAGPAAGDGASVGAASPLTTPRQRDGPASRGGVSAPAPAPAPAPASTSRVSKNDHRPPTPRKGGGGLGGSTGDAVAARGGPSAAQGLPHGVPASVYGLGGGDAMDPQAAARAQQELRKREKLSGELHAQVSQLLDDWLPCSPDSMERVFPTKLLRQDQQTQIPRLKPSSSFFTTFDPNFYHTIKASLLA